MTDNEILAQRLRNLADQLCQDGAVIRMQREKKETSELNNPVAPHQTGTLTISLQLFIPSLRSK